MSIRSIRYTGTLSRDHFRGVAVVALGALKVEPQDAECRAEALEIDVAGRRSLSRLLVARPTLGGRVAADKVLEGALRRTLGLGARIAEMVRDRLEGNTLRAADEEATYLGALFNAAIVLFDQFTDERPREVDVSTLPVASLVREIFRHPGVADLLITGLAATLKSPRKRLFLLLMSECSAVGARLRRRGRREEAWQRLGALVLELFEAHRALAIRSDLTSEQTAHLALSKSRLPSEVIGAIVGLTLQPDAAIQASSRASRLGECMAAVDDLADLLDDLQYGEVNTILEAGLPPAEDSDADTITDPQLYKLCKVGADRLARALHAIDDASLAVFARTLCGLWLGPATPTWPGGRAPEESGLAVPPTLSKGVGALLRERGRGYAEAIHWLRLPRVTGSMQTHPALLSQRAVIVDALFAAQRAGVSLPRSLLCEEVLAILQAKHPYVQGGWNYLTTVPELPPDADDLGQVLQALVQIGVPNVAQACDHGIRLLVDGQCTDGGIQTWIVEPDGYGPAHDAIGAYLPVMGGWGVHPEVVANFACGLLLHDPVRFGPELQRIAKYLAQVQCNDGHWDSKWYFGPFYGTFKALCVLEEITSQPDAVERALRFLLDTQRLNGSWGPEGGDPLSTALAILGLLRCGLSPAAAPIVRAQIWLELEQGPEGCWTPQPWIVFGTLDGVERFESATMTTSFCVLALAEMSVRSSSTGGHRPPDQAVEHELATI